ncbi:hypothetical protein [Luteolibacter sp. LG18]|uniref:hypothetical protein n=1 Tax=Luteolibacter sp. LG18 TaxID=2819286 RepID=UPI002B2B0F7D|nr:hypothetical protein llg_19160 [Luteolibacter sp. LG18]
MLSDDNSGIFWGLLGLIVLVLSGVGISLAMDKRSHASRSNATVQTVIGYDREKLDALRLRLAAKRERYDAETSGLVAKASELREVTAKLDAGAARITDLKHALETAVAGIATMETTYKAYAADYRRQAWQKAAGEQVASIQLRSGRRYEKVVIQRVTPAGLEITYAEGRARIDAADLDASWQDRLQWSREERLAVLAQERKDSDSLASRPVESSPPAPPVVTPPVPVPDAPPPVDLASPEVAKLRADLLAWNLKVSTLQSQYLEASNQARGNSPSVPGKLETWESRRLRLQKDLNQAQLGQAQARAKLQIAAPLDPALSPPAR